MSYRNFIFCLLFSFTFSQNSKLEKEVNTDVKILFENGLNCSNNNDYNGAITALQKQFM